MNTPDLHASSTLAADALYFLVSFASCVLALLGVGCLARPRHPQPATPLPQADGDDNQFLKTYLEHRALC